MLRDQAFLPIQLAPGGLLSLQGCCETSEPLLLASRPLAWGGWGVEGEVSVFRTADLTARPGYFPGLPCHSGAPDG